MSARRRQTSDSFPTTAALRLMLLSRILEAEIRRISSPPVSAVRV